MAGPYFQIEGGAEKKRLDFPAGAAELFIGRSPECQLVIASGAVSRRHARVRYDGGEVTIEDLGSSNGTFVNGKRLDQPRALKDRDRVALGSVQLTFVMPAEARPEPSAMATLHDDVPATVFVPKAGAPAAAPPKSEPPATIAVPTAAATPPPTAAATPKRDEPPAETAFVPKPPPASAPASPEPRASETVFVPKPGAPTAPPSPEERAPDTVYVPKPAAPPPAAPKRDETVFVAKPGAVPSSSVASPETPQTVYAPRPAAPAPAPPPAESRRPATSGASVKRSSWSSEAAAAPPATYAPAPSGPSVIELAVIALGSFLAVYAVGAVLIRFVF